MTGWAFGSFVRRGAISGVARTALSILAFPSETLDADIIYQMTRSAMEVFADAGSAGGSNSTVARTTEAWTAMLRSSAADGAIDAKTKEIITYALVILHRCGPCLQVHHEKALDMGITPE